VALGKRNLTGAEDGEGCWSRHRETSMVAVHPPGAFDHIAGEHTRLAEQFQANTSPNNIQNRIHGANFVKPYFFREDSMNFPLGNRNSLKHSNGLLLHPG